MRFPDRFLVGLLSGKRSNLVSGQPKAGRRPDLSIYPTEVRPTSDLKKMHGIIGPEVSTSLSLSTHPPHVQKLVAGSLIVNDGAWDCPSAAAMHITMTIAALPPQVTIGRPPPLRKGRAGVVLRLGVSFGAEWVIFKTATLLWLLLFVATCHARV